MKMKKRFLLLVVLPLLLLAFADAWGLRCDTIRLPGKFAHDPYWTNGNEFFVEGGKIFLIVWKWLDPVEGTADSILLSSPVGDNKWEQRNIPGKAYYLGDDSSNLIVSIEKTREEWRISFYDLYGQRANRITHRYPKQSRELFQYVPIPLSYRDGSIVFLTPYSYDRNLRAWSRFADLLSAGHGSRPDIAHYVEIIPSLLKGYTATHKSISYFYLEGPFGSMVIPSEERPSDKIEGFKVTESNSGGYRVYEISREDRCANFYSKDGSLISIGDSLILYGHALEKALLVPRPGDLPSCPRLRGPQTYSDVAIDDKKRIYFGLSSGELYVYDPETRGWDNETFNIGSYSTRNLRLIPWKGDFYVGAWCGDRLEITKCEGAQGDNQRGVGDHD
jgi:hypothetical protein